MTTILEFDLEWEGSKYNILVEEWDATEARGYWHATDAEYGGHLLDCDAVPDEFMQAVEEEIHDHFKGATYHD